MDSLPKVSQEALTLIKKHVPEANVREWTAFLRANPDKKVSGVLASTQHRGCYCALGAGLHTRGIQDEALFSGQSLYVTDDDILKGLGATTLPDTGYKFTIFDGISGLNDEPINPASSCLNLPWPAIADILESLYA